VGAVTWIRDTVANVPLQRYVGHVGEVEVGAVEFDGSNRMWVWSSQLADTAWGWATSSDAAMQALEAWLRSWLENFRPILDAD
jgi:hypothetical protein